MGEVNISACISKKSWDLIKSGKGVLEKGGVKVDGKFVELLKPVLSKTAEKAASTIAGGVLGGANLISSIGCNVQCAFIQKGVNQANQKLDIILNKMDDLCKAVGSLGQIQALSWLNGAVGIANLGVSIVGFCVTNKKLDDLSDKIDEVNSNVLNIMNMLEQKEIKEKITRFKQYVSDLQADIRDFSDIYETNEREIRSMLNNISTFIIDLIDDFQNNPLLNELYASMIFPLTSLFVQEVQPFSSFYYYHHNENYPPNYTAWEEVIEKINSQSFLNKVKRFVFMDSGLMSLPLSTKKEILEYTVDLARNQALQLEINMQNTRLLTFEQYCDPDAYYTELIQNTKNPIFLEDGLIGLSDTKN